MADSFPPVVQPARVVVLTAVGCPHCAAITAEMKRLARLCPLVHVDVRDLADAPDLAARFGIRAVPAVILDDDLCLEGQVLAEQVATVFAARGHSGYEAASCRALLEHGRIADAALRLAGEEASRAIAELLAAPELSMRMGAQLAVREAFEVDPARVVHILPRLLALTSHHDPAVRGDLADLLGSVGDASAVEAVRCMMQDHDPDVREAAADALAQLQQRGVA